MDFSSVFFLVFVLIGVCNLPLVHLQYKSGKFLGKYRIPKKTPDPININSKKVYDVNSFLPFSLHATLSDKVKVVNNGESVEVILDQKFTTSRVSGGVLTDFKYIFTKIKYVWTDNENGTAATTIDGKGYPLENVAIFYNQKYGSFENASNYRDGLTEVDFFIDICSSPNKLFGLEYEDQLKQIRKAGSSVETSLGTAIAWFAGNGIIPLNAPYYAYPGSYVDEKGKRYYSSTVVLLPHLPQWCLSKGQYEETFGSFEKLSGQPLTNTESQFPRKMPVVRTKGILNSNTP